MQCASGRAAAPRSSCTVTPAAWCRQQRRRSRCRTAGAAEQRAGPQPAGVAVASQQPPRDWLDVDKPLLWQGTEEDALQRGSLPDQLPPPWKMLLLSDGSVTRHLQLLTGAPITVDCMQMEQLSPAQLHQPPSKALEIPGPLVQRQVLLMSGVQPAQPLVYASSWWAGATVDRYLSDTRLPIWVSLAQGRLELFRQIHLVQCGHHPELEALFGVPGPFWSRQYYFWHAGAPLTLIHEVFSNSLGTWLGPLGGER